MPTSDAPVDLTSTIRQIHSLEQQDQRSAPFAERQRQTLLARHQETTAMTHATLAHPPTRPVLPAPARTEQPKSRSSRSGPGRWTFVLNAATVLALVLAASLAVNRLVDRPSTPSPRPAINAASTPTGEATPSPEADSSPLIWVASDFYGERRYPLYVPVSLAVGPEGDIFVLDALTNNVTRHSSGGRDLGTWVSEDLDSGDHAFNLNDGTFYLGSIAFDGAGNVYVFDSLNGRIQKFSSDGTFLLEWGTDGQENGQFSLPVGTVDAQNGLVYVADYGNNRVQIFDLEGNFIDKWGSEGTKEGQFNHPSAIAIGHDGSVYVGEDSGGRIQHFDRNGRYLGQVGDSALGHIYGMAIDSNGNLLATAGPEGEVWIFASDGSTSTRITEIPGLDSLGFPSGIAVDSDGSIILSMLPPEADSITPGPVAGGGSGPSGELIRFTIPALPSGT
jgi:DNA-binding beta-propeller fold protein YncE